MCPCTLGLCSSDYLVPVNPNAASPLGADQHRAEGTSLSFAGLDLWIIGWSVINSHDSGIINQIKAGPSGFEPETAGFLSRKVKSPVLYLAELRAQGNLRSYAA